MTRNLPNGRLSMRKAERVPIAQIGALLASETEHQRDEGIVALRDQMDVAAAHQLWPALIEALVQRVFDTRKTLHRIHLEQAMARVRQVPNEELRNLVAALSHDDELVKKNAASALVLLTELDVVDRMLTRTSLWLCACLASKPNKLAPSAANLVSTQTISGRLDLSLRDERNRNVSTTSFATPRARTPTDVSRTSQHDDGDSQQLLLDVRKVPGAGLCATLVSPLAGDPAMVEEVEPGGVAARAGLLDGDRVISVDGAEVHDNEDAARKILAGGETVQLRVARRKSAEKVHETATVTVHARDDVNEKWRQRFAKPETGSAASSPKAASPQAQQALALLDRAESTQDASPQAQHALALLDRAQSNMSTGNEASERFLQHPTTQQALQLLDRAMTEQQDVSTPPISSTHHPRPPFDTTPAETTAPAGTTAAEGAEPEEGEEEEPAGPPRFSITDLRGHGASL